MGESYWAGPGSPEDRTVELRIPGGALGSGVEHRISTADARRLARQLEDAADRTERWHQQLRLRCSNCGRYSGHRRCRDCGGTGRCLPRTSGRRPADECNTCRGWGCVPAEGAGG